MQRYKKVQLILVLVTKQHGIYCPGNIKSIGRIIIDDDKIIQTDGHEEQPLVNGTTKDDAEEKDRRVCISSTSNDLQCAFGSCEDTLLAEYDGIEIGV